MNMILKVENLDVIIDGAAILQDVNFEIKKGEVLAVIGPNGAGKTTLFKALLGFIPHIAGQIEWAPRIKVGYVPQRIEIDKEIPLTVNEFLHLRKIKISSRKIKEILNHIQLDEKILQSRLGELSIGQKQRLFIAWAMLENPDIILFDEPTADIDIHGQESIYKMVSEMQKKFKLTVILISHDLNVVYKYADKVMCLNHKAICLGTPQEVLKTESLKDLYGETKGFFHHQH